MKASPPPSFSFAILTLAIVDLGYWRKLGSRFGQEYIDAYTKAVGRSVPEEDFEDRLAMYEM